jgi:hypothetical protein
MNEYFGPDPRSHRHQGGSDSPTATVRTTSFEAIPSARGAFAREVDRPRTESYGELLQRASIYMRRT